MCRRRGSDWSRVRGSGGGLMFVHKVADNLWLIFFYKNIQTLPFKYNNPSVKRINILEHLKIRSWPVNFPSFLAINTRLNKFSSRRVQLCERDSSNK